MHLRPPPVASEQPEMEGMEVPIACYDNDLERYRVKGVTRDGSVLAIKPANILLPQSTIVTIKRTHGCGMGMRGRKGKIVDIENETSSRCGCYVVELPSSQRIKMDFASAVAA